MLTTHLNSSLAMNLKQHLLLPANIHSSDAYQLAKGQLLLKYLAKEQSCSCLYSSNGGLFGFVFYRLVKQGVKYQSSQLQDGFNNEFDLFKKAITKQNIGKQTDQKKRVYNRGSQQLFSCYLSKVQHTHFRQLSLSLDKKNTKNNHSSIRQNKKLEADLIALNIEEKKLKKQVDRLKATFQKELISSAKNLREEAMNQLQALQTQEQLLRNYIQQQLVDIERLQGELRGGPIVRRRSL